MLRSMSSISPNKVSTASLTLGIACWSCWRTRTLCSNTRSTTMMSLRDQVCETADRIVSAIHFCALNPGMTMATSGSLLRP